MERGVYFDAWYPRQHCYHPSLPPRRLRMVDDLRDYRATVLVWSALGGGSIALPYLEQEAFGPVDPRYRFYGFVNDSEFIAECQKHGIKVFGIVFEVQGWEFPVELNEAEDTILAINELRGVGKQGWLGLREFSQDRYPKLWPPFATYFPDGLINSDDERVTDLLEECCSRDINGQPCHAGWVECPDRTHYCYSMDRNNPVWREYLKAIIRIQIDAGVDGIQLDEAELPLTTITYGGCFCKDCMKGFRTYLQSLPAESRPAALAGMDLATFDYASWLRGQGYDFRTNLETTPLYWDYVRFQRGAIARYFGELSDYAKSYAASKGRDVLVSGNFYDLLDRCYPMEPKVDLLITEMHNTRYRQPTWYRYVAGFAGEKPVVVVENPYGGVVPALAAQLQAGRARDLFRMSLYEAAALGANMSVPYGSWMGSVIEDAYYAPHDLCVEVQTFLGDHEQLFSRRGYSEVGVIYSVESNFQLTEARAGTVRSDFGAADLPFWQVCETLAGAAQPYDVLFFPEGTLRPDTLAPADLAPYRTLVLPDCRWLTAAQARLLQAYLAGGGHLVVLGDLGTNLDGALTQPIMRHAGTTALAGPSTAFGLAHLPGGPQVGMESQPDLALHVQRVAAGAAIHVIRYGYDAKRDEVPMLPELHFELRLPGTFDTCAVVSPAGDASAEVRVTEGMHRVVLRNVPLYCIVVLSQAEGRGR